MHPDTTDFQDFDPTSRIWIFQSVQPLTEEDSRIIRLTFDAFVSNWTAHQQALKASFSLQFDHFLIVSIDARGNHATGCSLDALHQQVAATGVQIGKDFFDRLHIPIIENDQITFLTRKEIKTALEEGRLNSDSRMLDQTIQQIGEWTSRWMTTIRSSWVRTVVPQIQ